MCDFELVCVFGNGCVYCEKIVALTVFDLKGVFFFFSSEKVVFFLCVGEYRVSLEVIYFFGAVVGW